MQVDLKTGKVLDKYTIPNDCIDLANNNGAYLYDDLLAVLTVRDSHDLPCHSKGLGSCAPFGLCPCTADCFIPADTRPGRAPVASSAVRSISCAAPPGKALLGR